MSQLCEISTRSNSRVYENKVYQSGYLVFRMVAKCRHINILSDGIGPGRLFPILLGKG